jgi:hypothetical protein
MRATARSNFRKRLRGLTNPRSWVSNLAFTCALLLAGLPCVAQSARGSSAECPNDTVNRMGPRMASNSRLFLKSLKVAVGSNERSAVSRMVAYPVKVYVGDTTEAVSTPAEFVRRYDRIFTAEVKQAVRSQSSHCLFGNADGFMIGDGQVWFAEIDGKMKVISINTNP